MTIAAPPQLHEFIKAYDVRGLVPQQLSPQVATAIGAAFARVVALADPPAGTHPVESGRPRIVIGHDMRPSSPQLSEAFARGATIAGVDVVMIGLCSTDGLYFASGKLGLPGAMFTASHNPAAYNGIKLCRSGARPVGQDTGLREITELAQAIVDGRDTLHDRAASADGEQPAYGRVVERDVLGDYARFLRELVDLRGIRRLKVVVDAANGMGGHTVPAVLGTGAGLPELPLDIEPMYFELDGTFPNHEANPLDPKNLVDLQAAVVARGADVGLAFDGDADRCFAVDERGEPVSASAVTAMVAAREIDRCVASGTPVGEVRIVHNVISSKAVEQVVREHGAQPVRTRVGHSFIKAEMADHNAVFGGEHSAHYYFRDFWYADTGMLAAMHLLAALGGQDRPLSELIAGYDRYPASGEINSTVADVPATMDRVRHWALEHRCTLDELDGLTFWSPPEDPMWWCNVRASNTEPLLRLNVEAADRDTMMRRRDELLTVIRGAGG